MGNLCSLSKRINLVCLLENHQARMNIITAGKTRLNKKVTDITISESIYKTIKKLVINNWAILFAPAYRKNNYIPKKHSFTD